MALRSAPPVFGLAEAERIARDVYGLAVDVSSLSGERDCNFHARTADGRAFVLKIIDGAAHPQATDCQVRVLRHLAEQDPGLAVPRLHPALNGADLGRVQRDGVDYATQLLDFLPGELLSSTIATVPLLRQVGATVARIDEALQGFFHPALGQQIAWDVRRLPDLTVHASLVAPELRAMVEAISASFGDLLPALGALRSQAIHGDCHGGNLLVQLAPSKVSGVLDFGDVIHAPRVMDLAVALADLLMGEVASLGDLDAVVEGYAQRQRLESAEIEVLHGLVAARQAITVLVHAWRSHHDPAGARVLESMVAQTQRGLRSFLDERATLTDEWHRAAGTLPVRPTGAGAASESGADGSEGDRAEEGPVDLARRHRLMGAGAELFYDTPLHLVRGAGVWLYDPEGRAYLDVYNNVPHVGHTHPTVVSAIQRQTATLATHTRYLHGRILDYAERLIASCPAHLDACLFVNSGSEANDVAWRMAQFATGRQGGLVMAHAYHGITDAVAALTPGAGQPHDPRVMTLALPPEGLEVGDALAPAAHALAARDVERAARALDDRGHGTAAFFIDTALTSSGIFDPPAAWMTVVADRVRAAGGLVVADEVQYGLGRSGSHFWGFERRGLLPDLVTLGKPVGNGYPMGVVIARRELVEAFQARYGFFSTFGGNPVAASAGLAVLDVIAAERLVDNARDTGEYLRKRLKRVAAEHACLGAVRGTGLMLGLEITGPDTASARARTRRIVNALASRARVLIGSEGPLGTILKLRPPLPFAPEHADLLLQAIDAAASDIERDDA